MRYHFDEKSPHSVVFATSVTDLYNNHRINFDGINIGAGNTRHSSLDWFLIPKERPSIDKATVKEHYIDIPGINGGLDLTESLTGFPLYNYIEGSIDFIIRNDKVIPTLDSYNNITNKKEITWEVLNRDIREFLNGKKRYMMFEDDPSWYYEGRFSVDKYTTSEGSNSTITINYKVYPYKKLSTCRELTNPINTFFDTLSLRNNDLRELVISFWDKTKIDLYPDDNKEFSGSIRGQLPCGSESVPIVFNVYKVSDAFKLIATYENDSGSEIEREIETAIGDHTTKIRGLVVTNKYNKSSLYSDNYLKLDLVVPELYNPNNVYNKDDVVSYISTQEGIKWILRANTDNITGSFDQTKWDIDESIKVEPHQATSSYSTGDYVYIYTNNSITLCRATTDIEPEPFDLSKWNIYFTNISKDVLYNPVTVSVYYDIGVM